MNQQKPVELQFTATNVPQAIADELADFFNSPRKPTTAEGEAAFDLTCRITEHDAFVRECELSAHPDPVAQKERMEQLSKERVLLVAQRDALCDRGPLSGLDSAQSQTQAAPESATTQRRTLWDVVTPYIVETMQAGQYVSAKELFKALEKKSGPDSPFEKGEGNNRAGLFVREASQTLSLKTLQNNWPKLMTAAKK
jgi:hypothetical protein